MPPRKKGRMTIGVDLIAHPQPRFVGQIHPLEITAEAHHREIVTQFLTEFSDCGAAELVVLHTVSASLERLGKLDACVLEMLRGLSKIEAKNHWKKTHCGDDAQGAHQIGDRITCAYGCECRFRTQPTGKATNPERTASCAAASVGLEVSAPASSPALAPIGRART